MSGDTTRHLHLRGIPLWLARAAWLVVTLVSLGLTWTALQAFPALLQQGSVSLNITCQGENGQVTAEPTAGGPAYEAGIRAGDRLLAINGTLITPQNCQGVLANNRVEYGKTATYTVQTGEAPPRDYPLVHIIPRSDLLRIFLNLGMNLPSTVIAVIVLELIALLIFWAFGAVIIWERNDDGMALLTSALLLGGGIRFSGMFAPISGTLPVQWFMSVYAIALCLFFGIFPDGGFSPRWVIGLWLAYLAANLNLRFALIAPINAIFAYLDLILVVGVASSQVYRYFHTTRVAQRQQTKWVVFGVVVAVVGFYSARLPELLGITVAPLVRDLAIVVPRITTLVVVLALGFAILHYRLFEVDLVINRSLVYGTATVLLAVVFVLVVMLVRAVLGDQSSGVAFGVATLGVGALFNPTRKRLRNLIDRHVYGFRFDLYELRRAQQVQDITHPGAHTGKKLGGYHVLDVVGKGGMGEVYRAVSAEEMVALKILPDHLAAQEEFRRRFERESQTLTALNHPNIVKLHNCGVQDGVYYIAMELIEGEELSEIVRQRGRLSLAEVRHLVADCAAALDYAHQQGFVHRDIKSSNVMLHPLTSVEADGAATVRRGSRLYQAVLMDFGIAKIQGVHTSLTGTGAVGTIDYMAPEQILAAREVDQRADIYALGVVIYEALTGEKPFKGGPGQVLFAHLQQPPPDARGVIADLPAEIALALIRVLAKNPADRFQTAGAFAAAFNA